jgi:hypothetical protein
VRHEDVQHVADDLEGLPLQDLAAAVHVHRLSVVAALQEDDCDLRQVAQHSEDVLQQVGPHAARVRSGHVVLADDLQLAQEHAVVEDEEQQRAEVLQDGQQLHRNACTRSLLCQLRHVAFNLTAVLQSPQETEDLPSPAHLHVDVVGRGLGAVVLGVESGVLDEAEQLRGGMLTLSLLSVFPSRSRKVFRYCIKLIFMI